MKKNKPCPQPLKGIIPPMVTPLLDNSTLDRKGLDRLIEHVIDGGVHGLFILGTTGESTSLSYGLRRELIELTCAKTDGRVPVLVGISDSSMEESIALAITAKDAGADAVVAAPPFYFSVGQEELVDYYTELADRVQLPLILYNMPAHTKINIEPETALKLSGHPGIIGIKDSSGSGVYFNKLLNIMKNHKSFTILVGPEEMMAATVLMGGNGGVNGGANMFPKLYVDLYNAAVARDIDLVLKLQEKVMEVSEKIYNVGKSDYKYLQGLKAALAHLEICNGFMALPLSGFGQNENDIIKENLKNITD